MRTNKYIKNYIDGALVPALSGKYLDNVNPATGKTYSYLPDSQSTDVQRAVEAAERAFVEWSTCGVRRRYRTLLRLADIIEQDISSFARAESINNGKPMQSVIKHDLPRTHSDFRFFATAILHENASAFPVEGEAINYTLRRPLGVVACITSGSLSLHEFTLRIAPALAAGNCVVAKASEVAPMTAHLLAKACMKAGLPSGVLNIIHGSAKDAALPIALHPKIAAVAYTGISSVGKNIASITAPLLKKLSLQLGGKNAALIFADCNFDEMIVETLRSCFSTSGQSPHSTSRILVERSLYPQFKEEFVKRTQFLKLGDPFASITDLGAVISEERRAEILSKIEVAKMEGGTILCGGQVVDMEGELKDGFYLRPTVIEGLLASSKINQEEILGPVVSIMPFDTEADAIQLANSTPFGQSATLWTGDSTQAHRLAEKLRVGTLWVNCWQIRELRAPQGGVKNSGNGNLGGSNAIDFFTEGRNVCLKY